MSQVISGYEQGFGGVSYPGVEVARKDLYCQSNGSDKVYIVILSVDKAKGMWYTTAFYGKRLAWLTFTGKYAGPYESKARQWYNKMVDEKMKEYFENDGSITGPFHSPNQPPNNQPHDYTSYKVYDHPANQTPQFVPGFVKLMNPKVATKNTVNFVRDVDYVVEEAHPGSRVTIHFLSDNKVHVLNENGDGLVHNIQPIGGEAGGTVLEAIKEGDEFYIYDMLQENAVDFSNLEWKYRRMKLTQFINAHNPAHCHLAKYTVRDKVEFAKQCQHGFYIRNMEGRYKYGGMASDWFYAQKGMEATL